MITYTAIGRVGRLVGDFAYTRHEVAPLQSVTYCICGNDAD